MMCPECMEKYLDSIKKIGPFEVGKKYVCVQETCLPCILYFETNDLHKTLQKNVEDECFTAEEVAALEKVCIADDHGVIFLPIGTEFEVIRPTMHDLSDGCVLMKITIDGVNIELSMMLDTPLYEEFGFPDNWKEEEEAKSL